MFQLETQRLRLLPLGVALLREFTKGRAQLHAYLGLEPFTLQLESGFQVKYLSYDRDCPIFIPKKP